MSQHNPPSFATTILPTMDLNEVTREYERYKRELATSCTPKKYENVAAENYDPSFHWEKAEAPYSSSILPASSEGTIRKYIHRRSSFTFTN